jgi:hypothetical protein
VVAVKQTDSPLWETVEKAGLWLLADRGLVNKVRGWWLVVFSRLGECLMVRRWQAGILLHARSLPYTTWLVESYPLISSPALSRIVIGLTQSAVKTVTEDPYSRFTAAGSSNGWVNMFRAGSGWTRIWYYRAGGVVKSVAFSGRGLPTESSSLRVQGFTLFVRSSNGWVNSSFVYEGTPIWYYSTSSSANSVDTAGV